jgi:plasmid maintenance system antidote protein VapI
MAKSEVMETFARNTAQMLKKRGISTQQLADAISMDRSDVSKIVRGVRGCTLETAVAISKALDVPISLLVDDFSKILSTAS